MGYDDDRDNSRQRRSRARQPVKRSGNRRVDYNLSGREPRPQEPGLNLITDSFSGSSRRSRRASSCEEEKKRKKSRDTALAQTAAAGKKDIYSDSVRKKARKRKRRIRIILVEALILICVLMFGAYSYVTSRMDLIQRLPWDPEEVRNVDISQEKVEQMKGYWTIAIFGVDSRNSSVGKGNNSDVNIICNINQDTGEIKLVSVYRDTYLNVSDKNAYNKINSAYLQGGPEQAVKALNKNLDLDIDDYATFNWKAVADAINILGGIDVELSKAEFYYINAFITETVNATGIGSVQLKSAGMNHLDGVQAVAYGRLRLMDTDYARTERQRKVISLAFEKAKKADWATLNNIIQTVFPQVATSADMEDLLKMGRGITKYHLTETMGFPAARGEVNMGNKGACVIPQTLESNVTSLHQFLFGDEAYEPTETVKTISRKIISDTGLAKEKTPAGDVGTGGGYIPKPTSAMTESQEESESEETVTPWEEEGELPITRPGTGTVGETDSQGNLILPPGGYETEEESGGSQGNVNRPGTGETKEEGLPGGTGSTGSGTGSSQRPGETSESSRPSESGSWPGESTSGNSSSGGTGSSNPSGSTVWPGGNAPGSGAVPGTESSSEGNSRPGGQEGSGTGGQTGSSIPGTQTSTGVIINPQGTGSTGTGGGGSSAPGGTGTGSGGSSAPGGTGTGSGGSSAPGSTGSGTGQSRPGSGNSSQVDYSGPMERE